MDNNFSVLMCVYKNDSIKYLDEAFESILNQTLKPSQIVIVRDGKVPNELQRRLDKLSKSFSGLLHIVNLENNVGLSRALNLGIDHCDHEYIARMDADDISLNKRFFEQMFVFNKDPSIALQSAWVDQYNEDMTVINTVRRVPQCHDEIVRYAKRRTPINHTCSFFRKSAVVKVGKYPNIKSYHEDWWLALRLIKNGYRLYNIQQSLLKMRTGKDFYKRRSGVKYSIIEIRNLYDMYNQNLLSLCDLLINLLIRIPIRVLPNFLVERFYANMNRNRQVNSSSLQRDIQRNTLY
jgi:glycosyltransferase involved in cell wall biosynthesis